MHGTRNSTREIKPAPHACRLHALLYEGVIGATAPGPTSPLPPPPSFVCGCKDSQPLPPLPATYPNPTQTRLVSPPPARDSCPDPAPLADLTSTRAKARLPPHSSGLPTPVVRQGVPHQFRGTSPNPEARFYPLWAPFGRTPSHPSPPLPNEPLVRVGARCVHPPREAPRHQRGHRRSVAARTIAAASSRPR